MLPNTNSARARRCCGVRRRRRGSFPSSRAASSIPAWNISAAVSGPSARSGATGSTRPPAGLSLTRRPPWTDASPGAHAKGTGRGGAGCAGAAADDPAKPMQAITTNGNRFLCQPVPGVQENLSQVMACLVGPMRLTWGAQRQTSVMRITTARIFPLNVPREHCPVFRA
jgi:hypothetical protein